MYYEAGRADRLAALSRSSGEGDIRTRKAKWFVVDSRNGHTEGVDRGAKGDVGALGASLTYSALQRQ